MEINELEAFIVLGEELNFRQAAERLAMTQPPLSRLIAKLEDDLGVALFVRNTRKVEITAAGLALLKEAREIVARIDQAKSIVRSIGKLRRGGLNLSFTTMAYYSPLPNLVLHYREFFPDVTVELKARSFAKTWSDLNSGQADFIFCEGPLPAGQYHSLDLSSKELGVYLPQRHPLAKRKVIRINELKNPRFIFHPRSDAPHFYDSIRSFLSDHKIDYSVRIRKQGESCHHLVANEEGFLLASNQMRTAETPGIKYIPLEKPAPHVSLHAVWKDTDRASAEFNSFLSFLKESNSLKAPCPRCFMGLHYTKERVDKA